MEGERGGEKERGSRDGEQVTTNRLVWARMREWGGKGRREGVGDEWRINEESVVKSANPCTRLAVYRSSNPIFGLEMCSLLCVMC